MSELIQQNDNRATIRWNLLTGVSALALTAYVSSFGLAKAEDSRKPQVWIELGGQLSALEDGQETFSPPRMDGRPSIFAPSQKFESPSRYSIDETGKLTFQPENSNWVFSASIRYGRSSTKRHVGQQTNPLPHEIRYSASGVPATRITEPAAQRFADTNAQNGETHAILDFQAGRDVGLGLFGNKEATTVVSAGVRFAQFTSRSNVILKSDPDWHFVYTYLPPSVVSAVHATNSKFGIGDNFHSNLASLRAERSFHGVGPSLSWIGSAPVAGNSQNGELAVDWGINAALLFGRQRAKVHHQTTGQHHGTKYAEGLRVITYQPTPVTKTRTRSVTVPNVGGTVGLSWKLQNFKMSFGYRADFFFGAMDDGIDTRKTYDRDFYGPFATIAIGLGG